MVLQVVVPSPQLQRESKATAQRMSVLRRQQGAAPLYALFYTRRQWTDTVTTDDIAPDTEAVWTAICKQICGRHAAQSDRAYPAGMRRILGQHQQQQRETDITCIAAITPHNVPVPISRHRHNSHRVGCSDGQFYVGLCPCRCSVCTATAIRLGLLYSSSLLYCILSTASRTHILPKY